jgi:large subunit ribosomal protein L23
MQNITLIPIITEKSMEAADKGKFSFKVSKSADKKTIKKTVAEKFKVDVVSISTANVKGKKRRFGAKRKEVALPSFKKAIVRLKAGQKIAMFDAGATESQIEETSEEKK